MPEEVNFPAFPDPTELWKQWYEASATMWSRLTDGKDAKAQPSFPDPFTVFKQWYDTTSAMWSRMAEDVNANEEVLKASSQFLDSYARLYRMLRRGNEEYWHNLQLPTRSDIARVADLVVSLEEKVDRLDDAFDDLSQRVARADATGAAIEQRLAQLVQHLEQVAQDQQAGAATVRELQQRLDTVEYKLNGAAEKAGREAPPAAPARSRARKPAPKNEP